MADESQMIFRINDDGIGPELVREAFLDRGWIEFDEVIHTDTQWNCWWKTSRFRTSDYSQLFPWQRINHCPKATGITRKDCLARLLKLQHALHGSAYNFAPHSYILPNDYRKFTQEFSHQADKTKTDKLPCWICKPADLSRGRGISIIRELSELQYDTNTVVQQYITNPFLIHGHKFDIRLYVAVMSYHPLIIYLYNDGIVRFSCEKYDLSALSNLYSHLTNTSINRFSSAYNVDKAGIGHGSKWTIKQLRHYFHQRHIDDHSLWWQIILIINLTIIPQVSEVPRTSNCFELYGFDILVDSNLKPWLLEVNFSPSLSNDCPVDNIKKEMLSDLIDLMEFRPEDGSQTTKTVKQAAVARSSSRVSDGRQLLSRRPHSMVTKLPQLRAGRANVNSRCCLSANDSSEICVSEDDEESVHAANILTCSLSQLSSSNLVGNYPYDSLRRKQMPSRSNSSLLAQAPSSSLGFSRRTNPQPKCYSKPWRQESSSLVIKRLGSLEKKAALETKLVVGGFHLTYPFSTVTSAKQLSPRQMVIEAHQMIRSKISDHQCKSSTGNAGSRGYNKSMNVNIISPFPPLRT